MKKFLADAAWLGIMCLWAFLAWKDSTRGARPKASSLGGTNTYTLPKLTHVTFFIAIICIVVAVTLIPGVPHPDPQRGLIYGIYGGKGLHPIPGSTGYYSYPETAYVDYRHFIAYVILMLPAACWILSALAYGIIIWFRDR